MYKIDKDIPLPKTRSKYDSLLKMEIGDSILFDNKKHFLSAFSFLRRHFFIRSQTLNNDDNFEGRIWRIENEDN